MAMMLDRPPEPAPHRLSVDDYYKMAEVGNHKPEDRVELIEGEIIDMVPIGSAHGGTTIKLVELFSRAVADGLVALSVQGALRLDAYNQPQPDGLLLRPPSDMYRERHPTAADVLLLIEVSDTSRRYDRGPKWDLYARFQIPEVWIVDVVDKVVELFRDPQKGVYQYRRRLTEGKLVPSQVSLPAIDVAALLA